MEDFLAQSETATRPRQTWRSEPGLWRNPVFLCAIGLWLLRAAYAAFPDLFPEEAYYWNYARHLDIGYLDHPPMVAWLIRAGCAVFGNTEVGVRVFALVSSLVTSFFAYRLAAFFYDRRVAVVAVLLTQLLPFFFMAGWMMTPDAPLTACWSAALYFLARALVGQDARAWWGVGVALGFGMLSKYTVSLLGPAALIFLTLDAPSRRWFRHPAPYGSVALAILIFSPVIVWNGLHHWASFAFQSSGRVQAARHFSAHELAGAVVLMLTPLGAWLAGRGLFGRSDETEAAREATDLPRRRLLFVRLFTLTPLAVFALFSVTHRVKLNWTGPLWLAVVPLLAASFTRWPVGTTPTAAGPSRARRFGGQLTVAFLAVGYAALLQYLSFGLPGVGYARNTALLPVGWHAMGRALDQQASDLRQAGAAPVHVVGLDRDFIASEAAFYQADQARGARETTGAHLFGGNSLMYAYWFPPEKLDGSTLLLVSFVRGDLKRDGVRRRCQSLGPIQEQTLRVNGKTVCAYYTRVGYGYLSDRPLE